MEHHIDVLNRRRHRLRIANIAPLKIDTPGSNVVDDRVRLSGSRSMDLRIEVVQHANLEAPLEQRIDEVGTNESGPAGD